MAPHKKPRSTEDLESVASQQVQPNTQETRSEHEHVASTEGTHKEYVANTKRTRDFTEMKASELETFSIRLDPRDKQRLKKYFTRRGLSLSQGLRMWILDRMEQERID